MLEDSRWMTGLRLLISAYLRINMSISGHITTCIDWIAQELGFQVNHRAGKISDRIRSILSEMVIDGTIDSDTDILFTAGWTSPLRLTLNLTSDNYNPRDAPYVIFTEEELSAIAGSKSSAKEKMTAVYLHVKKRICMDPEGSEELFYCWPSLDTIASDASNNVPISRSAAGDILQNLETIGLLKRHITGSYEIAPGKIISAPNVYCLGEHEMDHQVCDALMKRVLWEKDHITIHKFLKERNEDYVDEYEYS